MSQMCPNPKCSHDNPDVAQVCAHCGGPLLGLLGRHTLLEGRYRVIRVLGCGGMGAVYLADDLRISRRRVAVKESLDITPQARSQLQTEACPVAIGDKELPSAAQEQLTGPHGYFRGMDGLPRNSPHPDRFGGPVICPWMLEVGYSDLREENVGELP